MKRLVPSALVVVASAALVGATTTAAARHSAATQHVTITIKAGDAVVAPNFAIEPGVAVTVTFLNSTRQYHTFTVPALGVKAVILPGSAHKARATRVTFTALTSGVFSWYCAFCPRVHHEGPMGGKVYAIIRA